MALPVKLERHGNLAAERSTGRSRDRINAGLLRLIVEPVRILAFGELQSPAARAQHDADSATCVQIEGLGTKSGVGERLLRRGDGQSRRTRYMLAILGGKALQRVDASHFPGNLYGNFGSIERLNAADSASGCAIALPQLVTRVSQRCQASETANDDPVVAGRAQRGEGHAEIISHPCRRQARVVLGPGKSAIFPAM